MPLSPEDASGCASGYLRGLPMIACRFMIVFSLLLIVAEVSVVVLNCARLDRC